MTENFYVLMEFLKNDFGNLIIFMIIIAVSLVFYSIKKTRPRLCFIVVGMCGIQAIFVRHGISSAVMLSLVIAYCTVQLYKLGIKSGNFTI